MNKGQIVYEGTPAGLEATRTSSAVTSAWPDRGLDTPRKFR